VLRGAIIGFGGVAANGHYPAYATQPDLSVESVVDPSPSRRAEATALGLRAYPSLERLFDSEPVDFVDICTPPALHLSPMRSALQRGVHVLCEKPFLLDLPAFEEVVELSRANQVCAFPAHNWKYAPMVQLANRQVRRGTLGPTRRVELCTYRQGHCKGTEGEAEDWRLHAATAGGGILIDHGWHAFYLLLQWIDSDPVRVSADVCRPSPGALEDEVDVRIEFENGAHGRIMLTWRAEARRNTVTVEGDRGSLRIDGEELAIVLPGRPTFRESAEALSAGSHHTEWFRGLLPDFAAAIQHPARRAEALREAGWCLVLTQAVYELERTRASSRRVELPTRLRDPNAEVA
jgi:predicted dehydrogenase